MKRYAVALFLVVLGFASGCGRSTTAPTPPTPVGTAGQPPAPPVPPTTTATKSVRVYVADTAFRVLAGVRMVVVNGPQAGLEMVSDSEGRSSYTGTFPVSVSVRAIKDGFVEATAVVWPSTTTDEAWVSFSLAPLTPPTPVAGFYTLTISADPGCTGIPGDVQIRSYQAAVTPNSSATVPANTSFNGQLTGARFAPHSAIFWIGVAADYVVVSSEGEGPSIVEDLGHNRYVASLRTGGGICRGFGARHAVSAVHRRHRVLRAADSNRTGTSSATQDPVWSANSANRRIVT